MSLLLVYACNGTWDGGRFPCRGSLPVPDGLDGESPADYAVRHGWAEHPELPWGHLCPSHARQLVAP